jgi:arylsulfatase A-like enzyme
LRTEKFSGAPLAHALPAAETTLAEALEPAAYHSTFVGKWHLGEKETDWPEHHGFDRNIAGYRAGHPQSWFAPYKNPRLEDGPKGEYLTERLGRETVAALKAAKESGRPFFICHSFYQVHTPLVAPEHLVEKYQRKREKLGLKDQFGRETQHFVSAKGPRQVRENQSHAVYAAMVETMDSAAGEILHTLDELGLADNTLVIFTSDNGGLSTAEGSPTSNLPFRGGKGWVYEGGIRVPFIVRQPGSGAENRVDATPVTTLDILPTALASAGLKAEGTDGHDLTPLLQGGTLPPRDLFWHYPHYGNQGGFPGGVIRSGDWKLVENYEDGSVSLHQLATDPGERKDLAAAEPQRVAEMRGKLHAWYRETNAKFLSARKNGPAPWHPAKP